MVDIGAAFAEYQPQLLNWIRQRLPEEAEDICSQVFFEAICRVDAYDDRGQMRAWLYTIARSRVVDTIRRHARRPTTMLTDWSATTAGPEDQIARADYHSWVRRQILTHLTDGQRQVIWLRFVEDLSIAETAKRLGMNIGQVKSYQWRGIANLRMAIAPDDAPPMVAAMAAATGEPSCSVAGCSRRRYTRGMCRAHYFRQWRAERANGPR